MTLKKSIAIKIDMGTARGGTIPLDATTGLPPAFWNNEAADVRVACFADAETTSTMTDVTQLTLMISERPGHDAPIVDLDASLDLTVTAAEFDAGTSEHGLFSIPVSTLTAWLGEASSKSLYLALWALDDGAWVCLANGPCTLYACPPVGA